MTPQELKNSILQLAIQGQLTDQSDSEVVTDQEGVVLEQPLFDVPSNWRWQTLGKCCEMYTGNSIPEREKKEKYEGQKEGLDYIGTKDVSFCQTIAYNNGVRIPFENTFKRAYSGSILMCIEGGSAGRKIAILDREVCFGNKLCMFQAGTVLNKYLFYYLQSAEFKKAFSENMTGIIGGVSIKKLKTILLPIPPREEQMRIVAKIEELLPYIDRYEQAWNCLEEFNKRFPIDMQKSILQLAIQGELVEHRPEEGTAEKLYQQIQAEKRRLIKEGKIKKEKPLPEIAEDEMPFEIPESWKWIRLQAISIAIVDCPHSTPKYLDDDTGYYAVGTKCMNSRGEITKLFNIDKEAYESRTVRLVPQANDIVYSREGSIVCRAVILPKEKRICLGQRVMLIRCPVGISQKYLQKYLMADQTVSLLTQNYKGVGVKHINVSDVCKVPVPIPPFAEQERIVAKLEELLPLCERLK